MQNQKLKRIYQLYNNCHNLELLQAFPYVKIALFQELL